MSESFLLDPKVDFVFKNLFMYEAEKNILVSFINSVVNEDLVVEAKIKIIEKEKHLLDDKFSRLEIACKTSSGESVIVEIRLDNGYNFKNRSIYYWAKLYDEQVEEREDCLSLKRTISINILNDKKIENDRFHNGYRLKEITTNEELTDTQEIHFIEIEKVSNSSDESLLNAWVEFLRNPSSNITSNNVLEYEDISIAKNILINLSNDIKQREFYELREKMLKDKVQALNTTEKHALEKGLEKGLEQGKEIGLEEGRLKEKIEIAKNLLDILDDWTISQKTGLEINLIKGMRK